MAKDDKANYPPRNYVPMMPIGNPNPNPSDGGGKGNVVPARATDSKQGKGNNTADYKAPSAGDYPNNPSKK